MKHYVSYCLIPTLFLAFVAYYIQTKLFLAGDVGYLIHAGSQLLAGASYGKDLFETNPPMILYLYLPPLFLAKALSISIATAVQIYVFSIAVLSISCCFNLLKRIFAEQDSLMVYIMTYTLMCVFLFMPVNQFGQREHLLMMFMMPYLFAAVLEVRNKTINPWLAFSIGLFAGIGFAFKPYFLITLCLVEIYFIVAKRSLWGWIRIESVTIAAVLIAYLASIIIFQPEYIKLLLPFVANFYFAGTKSPWIDILTHPLVDYCIFATAAFFLYYKYDRYRDLSTVLVLALIGMILAFMIPRAPWYYHVMPALGLSCLLLANYFGQVIVSWSKHNNTVAILIKETCFLAIVFGFVFYIPIANSYFMAAYRMNEKIISPLNQIADYIQSKPAKQTIFCFSGDTTEDCFPLVYDSKSNYGTRYPFFWWLRGALKLEGYPESKKMLTGQLLNDKKELINHVAEDLTQNKVNLVFVNVRDIKCFVNKKFNMIAYLSENKKFRAAWKHYKYQKTIGYYQIYERKV